MVKLPPDFSSTYCDNTSTQTVAARGLPQADRFHSIFSAAMALAARAEIAKATDTPPIDSFISHPPWSGGRAVRRRRAASPFGYRLPNVGEAQSSRAASESAVVDRPNRPQIAKCLMANCKG